MKNFLNILFILSLVLSQVFSLDDSSSMERLEKKSVLNRHRIGKPRHINRGMSMSLDVQKSLINDFALFFLKLFLLVVQYSFI